MDKKLIFTFFITLFLISAIFVPAQEKAQVMILGVYHFANPNADLVKSNFPDHLSDKKQKEIAEVLDLLAKFKPTKIVVERVPENTVVQNNYQEYLKGNYKLTANETEQIGFRLAKQFGHERIFMADHQLGMDFDSLMAAANETKNTQFLQFFQKVIGEAQAMQNRQAQMTVRDTLVELNQPLLQEQTKEFYLQMARVRSKDKFVGADVLAAWYQRNFRIFTNLSQIIDSPKDRVLVIFGQGHIAYLRDAVKSSPDMQLIEPNDYLKAK
ncbi:MAG TPA: DUF5694 domain-containing protein [Pyrinomonadaceae bacterium]|nr:DUF5694 domain-containing protein [Pyrinomonadaceae bacterium]